MTTLFAYFGPETTLPVASALTAVVGFVLMMGRLSMFAVTRGFGIRPRTPRAAAPRDPLSSRPLPRPE